LDGGLERTPMTGRLNYDRRLEANFQRPRRRVHSICPQLAGPGQLRLDGIDADHPTSSESHRRDDGCHAHTPKPNDQQVLACLGIAHIENGAASGQHCATKERRNFRGHISGHGYHGEAIDDRVRGKR
jgi:hypothetical protein